MRSCPAVKSRALSASGRSDQYHEFSVRYVEVDTVHSDNRVLIHFANAFESYAGHLRLAPV